MDDNILQTPQGEGTDNPTQMPDFDKLMVCKADLEELLFEYGNVLAPRIVEYEVERCEFPVEVLNEIRAIYAHIYRAAVATVESDAKGNIQKAKSHSKRAVLDCYKYLCVTYDNRYHDFFKKFSYINWSKSGLIEDVVAIDEKRKSAVDVLRKAKTQESTERFSGANPASDYRELYKNAYSEYIELMQLIAALENKVLDGYTIVSKFPAAVVTLVGVVGVAIGVICGLFL